MKRQDCENLLHDVQGILKSNNVMDVSITTDYVKGTIRILSPGMSLSSRLLRMLADAFEKRTVYARRSGTKFGLYIS